MRTVKYVKSVFINIQNINHSACSHLQVGLVSGRFHCCCRKQVRGSQICALGRHHHYDKLRIGHVSSWEAMLNRCETSWTRPIHWHWLRTSTTGNDNHVKHHCPNFKHLESFCELVRRWQKVPETTDTARLQSIKAFAANEDFLPFSTWSICLPLSSFLVLSYLSAGLGRRHGGTSSISSEFSESGESSSLVPKVSPGIHGRPPKVKLTLTVRADVQSYSLQIMKTNRPFCEGRCMSEIYLSMYKANTSLDVIAPSHSVEISICRLSVPGTLVAWKHSFGLSWQSSFWMFL